MIENSSAQYEASSQVQHMILIFILFVLSPVGGFIPLLLGMVIILRSKTPLSPRSFFFYSLTLSLYLGVINSTKALVSDSIGYFEWYSDAAITPFWEYVFSSGASQEPGYMLINYVGYYLTFGNWRIFTAFLTVLIYMFEFQAIYKFYRKLKADNYQLIFAVFLLALNGQFLLLSGHLIRQLLAASLLMFVLTEKAIEGKTRYGLLLGAVLIHRTTLLFLPFLFLKSLREKPTLGKWFKAICALAVIGGIGQFLLFRYFSSSIISEKVILMKSGLYDDFLYSSLPWILIGLQVAVLVAAVFRILSRSEKKPCEYIYYNIVIVLSLFVALNYKNITVQYRYIYFNYHLIPFIIPLVFSEKIYLMKPLMCIISVGLLGYTFWLISFGAFEFASLPELLSMNIVLLLVGGV